MEASKEIVTQDPFVTEQLQKFAFNPEQLIAMSDEYSKLTIAGVDDKQGYLAVSTARKALKTKRVEIQKIGKELRSKATAFSKAVIAREDLLVSCIEPMEYLLQQKEDAIDEEKDRIRIEADRLEDERIQKMIDQFSAVGAAVDYTEIKGMTEDQFSERLLEATAQHDKKLREEQEERERLESERLEEERVRRIREEEAEVKRKQQEEANEKERIRLKKIQDEQEEKDREFRQERAKFEQEKREHEESIRKEIEEKNRLWELEEAKRCAANDALEAKAKQDEADRLKKIEDDRIAEEKRQEELNEGPDMEKFVSLHEQITKIYDLPLWATWKAKSSYKVAGEISKSLETAINLCATKIKK